MTDIFLGRVTCSQRFASPYVLLSTRLDNPSLTLTSNRDHHTPGS